MLGWIFGLVGLGGQRLEAVEEKAKVRVTPWFYNFQLQEGMRARISWRTTAPTSIVESLRLPF
jgi:hypothetical protein